MLARSVTCSSKLLRALPLVRIPQAYAPVAVRTSSGYANWGEDPQTSTIPLAWITTATDFPGCEVEASLGVVRGVVVRSRNVIMDFFGSIQEFFGGNISIYASMCEKARDDATKLMMLQAQTMGANAVIAVRYESATVHNASEILCYGTAVRVVSPAAVKSGRTR